MADCKSTKPAGVAGLKVARPSRVGSLPLGISLLVCGAAMLYEANGGGRDVFIWLVRVWPSLLIIAGIEVIARTISDDFRFDFLSLVTLGILIASASIAYIAVKLHSLP